MQYYKIDGIHIAEVPVRDFKILMTDKPKRSSYSDNYANCGFFATYPDCTLPVGHLVCDFVTDDPDTKRYCVERGTFQGTKFLFDNGSPKSYFNNSLHGTCISTLVIKDGKAKIFDTVDLPDADYAVSGTPVMMGGEDVKFDPYVKSQGWTGGGLRATWHIMIGIKEEPADILYVMGIKTTSKSNFIKTAEVFKKLKPMGFCDVIKLDGGGSAFMKIGGTKVVNTSENRRVNNILVMGNLVKQTKKNPYSVPKTAVKYGCKTKNAVKWLQWQLNFLDFNCGEVDGSFGPKTLEQLKKFQASRGLDVDGSCGPATRAELLKT